MASEQQTIWESIVRESCRESAWDGAKTNHEVRARNSTRTKPWTISALNRLKGLAQAGTAIAEIQRIHFPDRTYAAVFAQIRKLGLAGHSGSRGYRAEELALVQDLVEARGLTAAQIKTAGFLPERSTDSIQIQIARLGLVDRERSEAVRRAQPWTRQQELHLQQLVRENDLTAKEIFSSNYFPGRTIAAIQERIYRLHLADPNRSERTKNARARILNGELERYRTFLRQNASAMTVDQIAEQWTRSTQLVRRDLGQLGIAAPRRALSEASLERVRSSARAAQHRRWAEWKERKRQFLCQRRAEIGMQDAQIVDRTCKICGEKWPLAAEFFHKKYNIRNGVKKIFFSRSCVLCGR